MKKGIDYRFLILALVWMSVIFWFSNQSRLFYLPEDWLDFIFKKTSHAAAYGILWLLWWLALPRRTWLAGLIAVLYALADEFHQTFVPGRHGQFMDVLIDTAGIMITMALAHTSGGRQLLSLMLPKSSDAR